MKKQQQLNNKLQYQTVPQIVTAFLREAILNGKFKGGEPLKQEELASSLNVSISPVREALKNLEAEGLVSFYPNRGASVSELSAPEAQEIFEIRLFLETGALDLSLPYLSATDFLQAEELLKQADCQDSGRSCSILNWKFHEVLYQAAQRPRLLSLIQMMHNNVERYMQLYLLEMNYQIKSQQEHRQLLQACVNGNGHEAKRILQEHLEEACIRLVQYLSKS